MDLIKVTNFLTTFLVFYYWSSWKRECFVKNNTKDSTLNFVSCNLFWRVGLRWVQQGVIENVLSFFLILDIIDRPPDQWFVKTINIIFTSLSVKSMEFELHASMMESYKLCFCKRTYELSFPNSTFISVLYGYVTGFSSA